MTEAHLSAWHIDAGIRNAESFFRVLPRFFPNANLFIAQGNRIDNDIASFYRRHPSTIGRPAELSRFTLTRRYICRCSSQFFLELARFAAKKPRENLLHHLYLYRDGHQLIEWHDAFANSLLVSPEVPETTIASLADKFGVRYRRGRFR
jgi:hypothetical protein